MKIEINTHKGTLKFNDQYKDNVELTFEQYEETIEVLNSIVAEMAGEMMYIYRESNLGMQ